VFGDVINLTGNVTDDTELSFCQIIINRSGSDNVEIINISLEGQTEAQCSNASEIKVYGGSVINYTIRVNDTFNNLRTNDTIITVVDDILPIVNTTLNKSLTNILQNDVINITANITDESTGGLSFCQIIINQSGSDNIEIINISLEGLASAECSNASEVTVAAGNVINYTIRVNDSSNNFRTNDTIIRVTELNVPLLSLTLIV